MQNIASYKSDLGTAILIVGGAGSGKTSLGLRLFPKTYIFVADPNFRSGVDYLKKLGQTANIVGFDIATPDETGKPVPPNLRYPRMLKCINAAIADPSVETIFIDSSTFIEDIIKAHICGAAKDELIKLEGFAQWGNLVLVWKSLIMALRQSGKRCIMSAHETKELDESDKIHKYQIAVDGSIRGKFPALFSDVLRCEIVEEANVPIWKVRGIGNIRQEHLKNTYGITTLIKADDLVTLVRKSLEPVTQPVAVPASVK